MHADPIVTEVRKAGQILAEQAQGDLHTFFRHLRKAQQQYRDRLVQAPRQEHPTIVFSPRRDGKEDDAAE